MAEKSIIGGEVFLKKRTVAHSAMAELLSKSNETQIKDKSPNRSHSNNPEAKPSVARRPVPVADSRQSTISRPVQKQSTGNTAQALKIPSAVATANTVIAERLGVKEAPAVKMPPQRAERPTRNAPPANINVNKAPVTRSAANQKKRVSRANPYKTIKAIACFATGAVVLTLVIVAASLVSRFVAEANFVPDAHVGAIALSVPGDADVLEISEEDATLHDGRHYVTVDIFEGEKIVCSTAATTVGEVLQTMNITYGEDYVLRGEKTDHISSDATISVDKITYATVTEQTAVPFETKYVDVQNIARGKTKVVKNGANGVSTATFKVTYVNGVESERELVSQVVTTQPTTQVVNRGVGGTITIGGKTYSYSYYIDCQTTVYTGGGITASGLPATENVIAVDPRVIPLGTKVYVADPYCYVGIRTAADTGGSIKGNIIDIYFDEDNPSLWGYGRRSARVYILD